MCGDNTFACLAWYRDHLSAEGPQAHAAQSESASKLSPGPYLQQGALLSMLQAIKAGPASNARSAAHGAKHSLLLANSWVDIKNKWTY